MVAAVVKLETGGCFFVLRRVGYPARSNFERGRSEFCPLYIMNCLQLLIAIAIEVHILDHLQKSKSNLTKHTNYKASSKLRKGLCETNCDIKKKQKSKSIQSRFSCYSLYGWWCIMRLFPPFVCRRRWGYPFRSSSISSFPVRSPWLRPSCLASFHSCSWKQGTHLSFFWFIISS